MKMRAMIVDDEPPARRRIRNLLVEAGDVEIVAECANGIEAIQAIDVAAPDLLFLDIQMPKLDGFEVLQMIGVGHVSVVIFVTAYDQFALRAFEAHALDYLLKPFDDERFEATLQRARQRIREQQGHLDPRLRALLEEMRAKRGYLKRLVVPAGHRSVLIATAEIDWIEADRNYIRLHAGSKAYVLRENISRIESTLDPSMFCRIHRSTIVNIQRIHAIESLLRAEYAVTLKDGTKLTSGPSYRGKLRALLGKAR